MNDDIVDAEYEEIVENPKVNVGTVGHCDHGKQVSDDEPINTTEFNKKPKMSRVEILDALKTAVGDGHVSAAECKRIKRDLGIFGSSFTKKSPKNRKSKRAAQKNARRKSR